MLAVGSGSGVDDNDEVGVEGAGGVGLPGSDSFCSKGMILVLPCRSLGVAFSTT